jgi:hypothetical protein
VFTMFKKHYLWSFFFWLDLVALVSLLMDVTWLWEMIQLLFGVVQSGADSSIARAGRASRAGTKAGRAGRIIRIIRLVRVVKLYKYCCSKSTKDEEEDEDDDFSPDLSGSGIGNKMSEFIMHRMIVGVLMMLVLFPVLEVVEQDGTFSYLMMTLQKHQTHYPRYLESYIDDLKINEGSLLYLFESNKGVHIDKDRSSFRDVEISSFNNTHFEAMYDVKQESVNVATSQICITTFISILLGVGAWLFSKDAHEMIIIPIERMVRFVKNLAESPLAKIKLRKHTNVKGQYEIQLLEDTLMKLAGLLQVGFGEAGAEIIANNIDKEGFNPLVQGQKVFAIYGFCDIRNFQTATEILQVTMMLMITMNFGLHDHLS